MKGLPQNKSFCLIRRGLIMITLIHCMLTLLYGNFGNFCTIHIHMDTFMHKCHIHKQLWVKDK